MEIIFQEFKEDFASRPEFKRKSFLLYKKLDKILHKKNLKITNFAELNEWFIQDIRLRRTILKYISYLENRFSAELINFWVINKIEINNLIEINNFIQFSPDIKSNKNIAYFNKVIHKSKRRLNHKIIDDLTFGDKVTMAGILNYYHTINKIKINFEAELFMKLVDMNKIVSLRNHIVHHGFAIDHKNLDWFLSILLELVDDKHGWQEKVSIEIKKIRKDFINVL